MADFNNTLAERVSDEEAQQKIEEMKEAQNRHIWTLRHEFKRFYDSLEVGAQISARLAKRYDYVCTSTTSATLTRPATFTIISKSTYTMLVECYDGIYRLICNINIKDLWCEGSQLVVIPCRMEGIC